MIRWRCRARRIMGRIIFRVYAGKPIPGEFAEIVADDPDTRLDLKGFHSFIHRKSADKKGSAKKF
jgi:hypothetical protein